MTGSGIVIASTIQEEFLSPFAFSVLNSFAPFIPAVSLLVFHRKGKEGRGRKLGRVSFGVLSEFSSLKLVSIWNYFSFRFLSLSLSHSSCLLCPR